MRAGHIQARRLGVDVHPNEHVVPIGSGSWLVSDRNGFTPCPWAVDLAQFCPVRTGDRIADLGCGAGALAVALRSFSGIDYRIELDPEYADQAA